ncbi:MAG: phosphate ABC transporter permease subunit PstC [Bryobacteraceae bacterium]
MASTSSAISGNWLTQRWRAYTRRMHAGDQIAHLITLICAAAIFAVTCLIVIELYQGSVLSRNKFGFGFIFSQTWNPVTGEFGALPFIYGTVVTSILALIIAVPTGLGSAVFLSELAPQRISDFLTFLIELLAAVPSVIYGLLGMFLLLPVLGKIVPVIKQVLGFLPIFSGAFYGVSIFSAGVILSLMIMPFIVSVSREVLLAVPRDQREAALALGASRWQATWKVVIPYAKRGIIGSVFLALARALGETMAVTMVIGNQPHINTSLFAPGYSIAAVIANEFTEATGDLYTDALIELGLVLFALTIVINGVARLLILTTERGGSH